MSRTHFLGDVRNNLHWVDNATKKIRVDGDPVSYAVESGAHEKIHEGQIEYLARVLFEVRVRRDRYVSLNDPSSAAFKNHMMVEAYGRIRKHVYGDLREMFWEMLIKLRTQSDGSDVEWLNDLEEYMSAFLGDRDAD